jgi:S1-C subfamily serine protease
MNTKLYYFFYFISITFFIALAARMVYVGWNQTDIVQSDDLAIPVVLAYNEAQQNRSSAVYIGSGYFLTAAHIIDKGQKQIVLETNLEQKLVAEVLWSASDYDVSLLYSEHYDTVDIDSYSIDCSPLSIGDELRFIGNPSSAKFITTWGRVSSYEVTIENMWKRVIPVDATIIPGMSGGAAVNENNLLRGINVGTLRAVSGMSPMGPQASFTGISYIVEAQDICFLMGKT